MPIGIYKHHSHQGRPFKKGDIPWNKDKRGLQLAWNKDKKLPQTSGKNHWQWKGGRYKSHNYWLILKPDHPFANCQGYVHHSRLVAEKCLGRYLKPKETIHHINKIRSDDRPANLYLFPDKGAHTAYHRLLRCCPSLITKITKSNIC